MKDVVNWLLEDSAPEIKYRTMVELQAWNKDEPEIWNEINDFLIEL